MSISEHVSGARRKLEAESTWHAAVFAGAMTLLVVFSSAVVSAEEDFDAFFKAFKEKRDGIGSLQASFEQKTLLPQEVITTKGTLYYSKPRRILFSTEDPERATLVDGRRGYEYDSEIKQMTIFRIEDHPRANIFFLGFDDDAEALKSAYELTLFETDDNRGRQGLKIKPRPGSDEEAYFIEANLYLRDEDYLPYRIHIINDKESQLYIDVNKMVTQPYQDLNSARFFVPEGVKVVENERVIGTVEAGGRHVPVETQEMIIEEKELPAHVSETPVSETPASETPASETPMPEAPSAPEQSNDSVH